MFTSEFIEKIQGYLENLNHDFISEYFQELNTEDYFKLAEILSLGIKPEKLIELNKDLPNFTINCFQINNRNWISHWHLLICINAMENYANWVPSDKIVRIASHLDFTVRVKGKENNF